MLSGLFKRKDKKGRNSEDDGEELERQSEETSRASPQPKVSSESLQEPANVKSAGPQRQSSKLQKQPPQRTMQEAATSTSEASSPVKEESGPSIRRVVSPSTGGASVPPLQVRTSFDRNPVATEQRAPSIVTSPVKSLNTTPSVEKNTKVYDDPIAEEPIKITSPVNQSSTSVSPPHQVRNNADNSESLSDSPVNISPIQPYTSLQSQPPGLIVDTSSQEEHSVSPLSSHSSSPEFVDRPEIKGDETTPVSTVSSTATATWSDASLRSYLEDENDIRDLLIIVHDKSNVQPAGPDHPITGSLFKEESRRLKEMSGRLDEMLAGWISRKTDHRVSKAY